MDPVVHFEMAYTDKRRLGDFYGRVFGWQMEALGEEMGHYVLAGTTPSDECARPREPGCINGGFFPKEAAQGHHEPSVVIAVTDLHAKIRAVRDGGGDVLGEPMPIPGVGLYVAIRDTEGNRVGMLQPEPRAAS